MMIDELIDVKYLDEMGSNLLCAPSTARTGKCKKQKVNAR
jgi:hypothetical protein